MGAVIGARTVKARKRHPCYWCGQAIEVGEVHEAWAWADDGTVSTTRCHAECKRAWEWAAANIDRWYYAEQVGMGDHRRGCACERGAGNCVCGMSAAAAKGGG